MKKLFAFVMSLCLLFALTACGGISETQTPTIEKMTLSSKTETVELDVGITGYDITEDYEGKPVLVVLMNWTNTSEETTMFSTTYSVKAYQNGVGLDTTVVLWENDYLETANARLTEIRPGASIEVAAVFLLANTESEVEIEIDDWISFDNKPLISTVADITT